MTEVHTSLTAWGLGLAAMAYAVLAVHLVRQGYLKKPVNRAGLAIIVASVLTALWAGAGLWALKEATRWIWVVLLDIARYAAWFAFVVQLFRQAARQGREVEATRWMTPLAILMPLLSLVTLVLPGLWAAKGGHVLAGFFTTMMLLSVLGMVLVEQLFRNLPDDALWSAKPICLGLAGTFLFDLFLFSRAVLFGGIDHDAWNIRGLVHGAMMPLLLLSASRHRNWIGKIQVSRKVVFHSATLLLAGAYLLFISGVGYYVRYFGSDWGPALQLALVFLALVVLSALALSASLRARLRVMLGKNFFRYRYDYRDEWLKFTRTLSSESNPQAMGQRVVRGLADMLESPAGGLWLKRPEENLYRQVASWNLPLVAPTESMDSPLLSFMRRTGWVVNLEEYRSSPQRYEHLELPQWLALLPQAWLLVPLWLNDEELPGFVLLAQPRTRLDVNWEVNDLLKTAGRQAASFLAQMQATEALLEARKFEAFSRMSAFVVHDLKNIVTQLSLMVKNAKRLSHNPEFQADMLMTVENSLDRMRQLMLQLREGAAAGDGAVGVDLGRVARRLANAADKRGRSLELDLEPNVATRGHEERLERVLGHLVNNALDATEASQRVWLKLERFGSHARVEVGDNGLGMSEAFVRERLFKPFQTTKEAGMGIGAYESFQYVQELGGKVSVDSKEGAGTVVSLLLPLIDAFQSSDLHPLGET
ncbi:MAG: XrtA/PEP-CTERM system histidine kinase PrsK [Hydrogenophaga sp.]|uniref:XrtA/PEP-CTERM system histidine kinase PrsK n=1 Tax=Hydrogenophaga sp. TaxID=1904254 RepID=UPI003D0A1FAC